MNFELAFEEFKIYASKRHKKQSFDTLIERTFKNIYPYFKGTDIFKITKSDIVNWQSIILDHKFSNNYNQFLYSAFSQLFSFFQLSYNLDHNLVREVGPFPKHFEEKKYDFYNLKEFKLFIKNVDNNIYKQFFNLLYFTGLRPGEAMALRFSDLDDNYLTIRHNIHRKGKRLLDSPKNVSSNRTIIIDRKLHKDLVKLYKSYIILYGNIDDFYIFGGLKPLSPTSIDRYKLKACKKCGLRPITQQQFRHSHATLLIEHNIPINEVSRRLGHSRISTTLDIYTHNSLLHEKRVLAKLNFLRF